MRVLGGRCGCCGDSITLKLELIESNTSFKGPVAMRLATSTTKSSMVSRSSSKLMKGRSASMCVYSER